MADRWFYRLFGEVLGPVTYAKLQDLVHCGTLTEFDEVRVEDAVSWTLVSAMDWGKSMPLAASEETDTKPKSKAADSDPSVETDCWYCLLGDSVFGPWTFEELTLFAQSRQLKSTDEVKLGEDGKWRKVGSIGRLMALLPYEEQDQNAIVAAASGQKAPEREGEDADNSSRKQEGKTDSKRTSHLAPVIIKQKSDSRRKSEEKKPLIKPLSALHAPLSALQKRVPPKKQAEEYRPLIDDDGPLIRDANQATPSRRTERRSESTKDAARSSKASLFDESYKTPVPGPAPKARPPESADDEFELAAEIAGTSVYEESSGQAAVNPVAAVPTQAAYNVAYEQAKAKIAQSMITQAEASFRASEELARSHIAWATAPNVDPFWYGWASGVEFGPVEFNQVFGLAKSGQLKPTDFVRNGQYSQFGPAANVPGLYTAASMVNQAAETLNLAKSQAMTIASLAGYAPTAPVELLNAVAAPTEMPAAVRAPTNRSTAEIATANVKSNPAITTVGARPKRPTAEIATTGAQGQEVRKPKTAPAIDVQPDGAQKPAAKRRPSTSNLNVVTGTRPATNADVKVKNASAEMTVKGDASVAKRKSVPAGAASDGKQPKPVSKSNSKGSAGNGFFGGKGLLGSRIKDPKSVGGLCALVLFGLIFAWQYLPKDRSADRGHYLALKAALDEIREARAKNPAELERLKAKFEAVGKEIAADLKNKANRYDPAKQYLLWVARDELPRFLTSGLKDADSQTEKAVEQRLREASYELGIEKRPPADPNLQFADN